MPAGSPRTKGDEVKLMFQLFDEDHDGVVTKAEMKEVLQRLDPTLWTDAKVEKVLSAYDGNGDDCLQFTEFWGWVCGHGGKSTADFKPALLSQAIEQDRERRSKAAEKREKAEAKKQAREAKEAELQRKKQEREDGQRLTRDAFVKEHMAVGLTKEVALEMFNSGDADIDGDIDSQERVWLAGEHAATTRQIRSLYQKSAGGTIDAKGNLVVKEVDTSGMDSVVQAFLQWDRDGSGSIEPEELGQVLRTINPKMGMKTVEALCKEMDANNDGSIDIVEFIDWLSGESTKKKQMKKKAREEQDARVACSLHRKRAEEAAALGLQVAFEQAQHKALEAWCARRKIVMTCNTLNPGPKPKTFCKTCSERHGWLCHGCGFVTFADDCPNGCQKFGWSCIVGVCAKKKCGCKKKADVFHKTSNVHGLQTLSCSVQKIIEAAEGGVSSGTGASSSSAPAPAAVAAQ